MRALPQLQAAGKGSKPLALGLEGSAEGPKTLLPSQERNKPPVG